MGGELFHNLLNGGFTGPVYPVNPNADVVQSVAAYRSILAIPGPVDLAVVVAPAASAVEAVRECGRKGVKSVIVVSPGFAETGPEGPGAAARAGRRVPRRGHAPRRAELHGRDQPGAGDPPQRHGLAHPADRGRVGFLSQSGALGLAIIEHANRLGLGLSSFISIGNKADLSGNDFLQYWEDDPASAVLALYLESFGNPRKFARIARRVGRTKPIIAVKSGRSAAGARATSSHTGALIGASDVTVDALFRQAGVIRTDTLGEFFDVAALLANQPLPAGRRVAILTNGGGPGILAADACEADGLIVPALPEDVRAALAAFLPAEAALANPVDTIDASPDSFRRAIGVLAACPEIHAIIVLFVPPLGSSTEQVAAAIHEAVAGLERPIPVLAVFMAAEGGRGLRGPTMRVPAYSYPRRRLARLAHAVGYAEWRAAPPGTVPAFDDLRGRAVLATALAKVEPETAPPVARLPGRRWRRTPPATAPAGSALTRSPRFRRLLRDRDCRLAARGHGGRRGCRSRRDRRPRRPQGRRPRHRPQAGGARRPRRPGGCGGSRRSGGRHGAGPRRRRSPRRALPRPADGAQGVEMLMRK